MSTDNVAHDPRGNEERRRYTYVYACVCVCLCGWIVCLNALARLRVRKHIYALRNGTKSRALDGNGSACHSWIHKHVALLYIHATGAANNLLVA